MALVRTLLMAGGVMVGGYALMSYLTPSREDMMKVMLFFFTGNGYKVIPIFCTV